MSSRRHKPLKPPALRPGDTVGIVALASSVKAAELEAGRDALRHAGYKPFLLGSITEKDLYFAGSVNRRIDELEEMILNDEVRAIVCARGGYGSNYLLPQFKARKLLLKMKAQPKIFIGYSDLTSLLTYFTAAGIVTFHGPMVAKDWAHEGGVDFASWNSALTKASPWDVPLNDSALGLVDGVAEGVLYGGCLSILVASLGTPYEIHPEGAILFLEDIGAKPYQIDRMLMQLKLSGHLAKVRGIVFGEMLDCVQTANQGYTLQEVILRIVGDIGVPVAFGVKSGHVSSGNITLPFGVSARLSVSGGKVGLRILEGAVSGE
jgi:muramoyltetrapeptide carboxypeptidase